MGKLAASLKAKTEQIKEANERFKQGLKELKEANERDRQVLAQSMESLLDGEAKES